MRASQTLSLAGCHNFLFWVAIKRIWCISRVRVRNHKNAVFRLKMRLFCTRFSISATRFLLSPSIRQTAYFGCPQSHKYFSSRALFKSAGNFDCLRFSDDWWHAVPSAAGEIIVLCALEGGISRGEQMATGGRRKVLKQDEEPVQTLSNPIRPWLFCQHSYWFTLSGRKSERVRELFSKACERSLFASAPVWFMALCNLEENACNEIRVIRVAGIDNLGSSCCRLSPLPPRSLELRQLTRSLAGWLADWLGPCSRHPAQRWQN